MAIKTQRQSMVKSKYVGYHYDGLYNRIPYTAEDLKLYQTKELSRIRQLSLSAIPTWSIPTSVCDSKFAHSVGTAHLARIVCEKPEFKDFERDIYIAALGHDIGTPPFSHASEYFLVKILGKNHEEFAADIIQGSEFAKEAERQGASLDKVLAYIIGAKPPISDLINGTIDLDNLDNTLRYGSSMGICSRGLYSPEHLAEAFTLRDGKIMILPGYKKDLEKWEKCRQDVYQFVYSADNLSTGTLLFRALDFARREGELSKKYFLMTDAEAFFYLKNQCNPQTQKLMERLGRMIFYHQALALSITNPSPTLKIFIENSDNRGELADGISKELKIKPEDVCVYAGRNKGFKQIHLPVLDENQTEQTHIPNNQPSWMVQVYIYPELSNKKNAIEQFIKERFPSLLAG